MARTLTAGMITELTAAQLSPVLLIKAEFDSGNLCLWSGIGSITYSGDTYLGAGNLLSVSAVTETVNLEANGVTVTVSGIPSSIITTALTEDYQGRKISFYFGCLNTSGALISDPYLLFKGRMDVMDIVSSGETISVAVTAESATIDFRRVKERRFTKEDQQAFYATDKGLEYISQLQDKEVIWGRASPKK